MKKSICIDLDGVLADYSAGWQGIDHIGEPIPGAVEMTKQISEFADVVIFTTRCNPAVNKGWSAAYLVGTVKDWLDKHGFFYSEVYCGIGKPIAAGYIDDRAIVCMPQDPILQCHPKFQFLLAVRKAKALCGVEKGEPK